MKLEVNITKTHFWVLVIIGIMVLGGIVFAVTSTTPNPGHSLDEIDLGGLTADKKENWDEFVLATIRANLQIKEGDSKSDEEVILTCDNSKKAIGCSFYNTKDEDYPDEVRCKAKDDKCYFYQDVDESYDSGTNYCYCI
ncbi:hypothetical protein HZC32_01090 [Candidatus Woesearchaeota archaeon]|nr:hypothetical protein [Candidatus Woesearchaeota archaeon]